MKVQVLLVCAWLASVPALSGGERLGLKVTPAVSFAPADVTVRTTVEANAGNRWLEVEVNSLDFYRSSRVQLEGEDAPRTRMFQFRGVPSGIYDVSVALVDADGARLVLRREISVVGQPTMEK
jgi:hypothetical protein